MMKLRIMSHLFHLNRFAAIILSFSKTPGECSSLCQIHLARRAQYIRQNLDHYFKKDEILRNIYVFDDGLIRGFLQMNDTEICKLYVDPFFQGKGIGNVIIEYAVNELHANYLWALEKNVRAISFYQRHGFHLTAAPFY